MEKRTERHIGDCERVATAAPRSGTKTRFRRFVPGGVVVFFIIIIIIGYFDFVSYGNEYIKGVCRTLSGIEDLKVNEIKLWRHERLSDGRTLLHNSAFSGLAEKYFANQDDKDAMEHIRDWLESFRAYHSYDLMALTDASGHYRISVPEASGEISYVLKERIVEMRRTKNVVFQDFYRSKLDGKIRLAVLVPIFSEKDNEQMLGVVVLGINPEIYLYPIIERWPLPSETAETLIVRREGDNVLFLNKPKFKKIGPCELRIPLSETQLPAVKAVLGQQGIVRGIDYKGAEVFAALGAIPDSPWFMVARMDLSEIQRPLKERMWVSLALLGALLVSLGSGMGFFLRSQKHSLLQAKEALLQKSNQELEERVGQRTAELVTVVKEMEAFSYSVSHDLKAPLRAMSGFANILAEDYAPKLDENGRRVIKVINDGVRNMGQLIDDLLKLAQMARLEMNFADIDIATLVQSVDRELREELFRDRSIEVSLNPLPVARADATLTKQIFMNLISNAMKFTAHKEKAVIEVGGSDKDGECVYYVKDNGAGFDMKYEDKLFGIFQRLHTQDEFGGTGIGLAIVKSAVRRHGGRVWAESKVGQGATFYFTLQKPGGGHE